MFFEQIWRTRRPRARSSVAEVSKPVFVLEVSHLSSFVLQRDLLVGTPTNLHETILGKYVSGWQTDLWVVVAQASAPLLPIFPRRLHGGSMPPSF